MSLAVGLTVIRALAVVPVVILYAANFGGHDYWATAVFCVAMTTDWFDGRIARSRGYASPLGSLLDPIADKILVLAVLVMLIGRDVVPAWMVAAIVVREFLVTGLRLAAVDRGIVLPAHDLGKLKTWAQAVAAALGGFAAAGAWRDRIAWWGLLVAVVLTWVSGLDYARVAPRLWRKRVRPQGV
jgi:CDP-diacylglycerol--glycerol-3-phosphate 3-phosphatidyltransferase